MPVSGTVAVFVLFFYLVFKHLSVYIFTVHYASPSVLFVFFPPLTLPLQQVQTCVWDVPKPFRIVLVKGSKVNAEETAKVNSCCLHLLKSHVCTY